jgi:hypothetical protein
VAHLSAREAPDSPRFGKLPGRSDVPQVGALAPCAPVHGLAVRAERFVIPKQHADRAEVDDRLWRLSFHVSGRLTRPSAGRVNDHWTERRRAERVSRHVDGRCESRGDGIVLTCFEACGPRQHDSLRTSCMPVERARQPRFGVVVLGLG